VSGLWVGAWLGGVVSACGAAVWGCRGCWGVAGMLFGAGSGLLVLLLVGGEAAHSGAVEVPRPCDEYDGGACQDGEEGEPDEGVDDGHGVGSSRSLVLTLV